MDRQTIFCVQPYWYDGRRLARGEAAQFRTRREAERTALKLYENHAGVTVFSVSGVPEFDCWDDPRCVMSVGRVPGA